jgi:hypothetical protein
MQESTEIAARDAEAGARSNENAAKELAAPLAHFS